MTYASLLLEDGIESNYLAVIKPRRLVDSTTWTNTTGTIYWTPFAWGDVVALTSDGIAKTLGTTAAPGSGEFYWDPATERLYLNVGADPDTKDVVATYEIRVATRGVQWHRVPTNTATRVTYFEPILATVPTIALSATDSAFGFIPSQSSALTLANSEHVLEPHLYDSSFSGVDVDLYHWLGARVDDEPDAANMKLVYSCLCQGITYNSGSVTLEMTDRNEVLNSQYRPAATGAFYTLAAFPALDPAFLNRPIRQVYGPVNGVVGVNIDYSTEPTEATTTNRKWVLMKGHTNLPELTKTVVAFNDPTYDWIQLDNVTGLQVGDTLALYKDLGPGVGAQGIEILDINPTTKEVKHKYGSGISIPGSGTTYAKRTFVRSAIWIGNFDGTPHVLEYGRHFVTYIDATNGVCGVELLDDFEASWATEQPMKTGDRLYFNVLGHTNTTTLGGSAFGANDTTGELNQGVVVLFDLLKNLGVPESQIDTGAFTALQSTVTDSVGFAIPHTSSEDFPTYRDLFGELMQTLLLKMFVDFDGKWTVSRIGPMGAASKTVDATEIIDGSTSYGFDYREVVTLVQVEYAAREYGTKHEIGSADRSFVTASSTFAKRLHGIEKQQTFKSLHFDPTEAAALAERLSYIFGDRQGRLSISMKNRFFDVDISDVVTVSREALPGYAHVLGTARTRDFVVVGTSKNLAGVTIELDDQKGIEDNAGSW